MNVEHLISSYGYYAVFLIVGLESVGIPLPGETALIAASTYAATSGNLNIWVVFAAAAAGAIIGDNVGYWIGNKGGYKLARKYGPKIRLDERKLKVGRYVFDRHGGKVVFFGRFVSVLRTFAAFLAGTLRMSCSTTRRSVLPSSSSSLSSWSFDGRPSCWPIRPRRPIPGPWSRAQSATGNWPTRRWLPDAAVRDDRRDSGEDRLIAVADRLVAADSGRTDVVTIGVVAVELLAADILTATAVSRDGGGLALGSFGVLRPIQPALLSGRVQRRLAFLLKSF
jgi:membrane protein YqaA with SNARE-associated domain